MINIRNIVLVYVRIDKLMEYIMRKTQKIQFLD